MAFYVAMICSGTYTHILLFCVLPDVDVISGFLSHVIEINYVTRSIPSISGCLSHGRKTGNQTDQIKIGQWIFPP